MEPLMGIYAAVTRRTLDGAHPDGWVPEQKISVAEAVRAYTAGSAYAEGQDAVKGTLEPGKLADLVVLSDDIFAIDPAAIEHVRVDATLRSEEHTSELQSLMRISYAVFCLKKKNKSHIPLSTQHVKHHI